MKILFRTFFTFLLTIHFNECSAQAPQGINYQAVLRASDGSLIQNQSVTLKFIITRQVNTFTQQVYQEEHTLTTNNFGLVNLVLGTGDNVSGEFSSIDWSDGYFTLETQLNNVTFTIQGLQSVPFSLFSNKAGNGLEAIMDNGNGSLVFEFTNGSQQTVDISSSSNSTIMDNGNGTATITDGTGTTVVVDIDGDNVDDADNDPLNELQDWNTLPGIPSDFVDGVDNVEDGDSNPNNEIQLLSFSNDTLYLSNGGFVYLGNYGVDLVNDNDSDPVNEIQDIATNNLPGNIALSNGSTLNLNVDDADSDASNELQDIATNGAPGNVSISNGSTININVNDADSSSTNELQDASQVSYDNASSGLSSTSVQGAIDELTVGLINSEVSIKNFTNADFLSDCPTLGSGTWQTIAIIPGISPFSAEVDDRVSYGHFQIYDYSHMQLGGDGREYLEFTLSRFWNNSTIEILHHDSNNNTGAIKIEKVRVQHGKQSIGGGSVWCANIQVFRSNTCGNSGAAETELFVKLSNQIPLDGQPLHIIPIQLTSTPLSLTNILNLETNVLNVGGDAVSDADSDPTNELELPTNANVGDVLQYNGTSWVSATAPSSGGAGTVMYIYDGQSCPAGWSTQQINVGVFGGAAVDACYTDSPCAVMYIYDGQTCPSGWTLQPIGVAIMNGSTTPVDACFKCY